MRLATFDNDRTLTVDSAESVFRRDDKIIALYQVSPARVRIRSLATNPERVILYRASGRNGLCIYYYRNDVSRFHIAYGDSHVPIQRDDIYSVRKAIRKFTQNARPGNYRKPGKPFTEYDPP